jgi:hypothetical protein
MVTERFYNCATADCRHGIHELKNIGEGRELTRLENMQIRIAYYTREHSCQK